MGTIENEMDFRNPKQVLDKFLFDYELIKSCDKQELIESLSFSLNQEPGLLERFIQCFYDEKTYNDTKFKLIRFLKDELKESLELDKDNLESAFNDFYKPVIFPASYQFDNYFSRCIFSNMLFIGGLVLCYRPKGQEFELTFDQVMFNIATELSRKLRNIITDTRVNVTFGDDSLGATFYYDKEMDLYTIGENYENIKVRVKEKEDESL